MTLGSSAALFGTMLILAVSPGSTDVALVARSIGSGRAHGLVMVCGIVAADFFFILCAVAGLATLAGTLGGLFQIVRMIAAAYLIVLGVGLTRSGSGGAGWGEQSDTSRLSSLSAGFLLTLGDPKAILGYMSLLPAFVDLSHVSVADTLTILLFAATAVGGAKTCYACMADRASVLVQSHAARRKLDILAGVVLCGTGALLIVQSLLGVMS